MSNESISAHAQTIKTTGEIIKAIIEKGCITVENSYEDAVCTAIKKVKTALHQ